MITNPRNNGVIWCNAVELVSANEDCVQTGVDWGFPGGYPEEGLVWTWALEGLWSGS